ncbi:MAG: ATP phosphoribosyltransferase regulatory subunit [Gammaproteobacteria bacterium]|nr:MAG: ATP phosphoribosyltransferase regulatory subunit [Gammaproteobacteria bacterium]
MTTKDRWLLPDGIEEVLPEDARRLELLRRQILDLFNSWGYELVMPPMIEYLESLLTGLGEDLDLQTFKITDQLSGRLMGVRPDITPQAARIDAHYLKRDYPTRLCYLGPVLRTRPGEFAASREPLQVGAELFGHEGLESDAEVLMLMASTLQLAGVKNINVSLGHVGIYRDLCAEAGLSESQETELFAVLQRKSAVEAQVLLNDYGVKGKQGDSLMALLSLNGDQGVLVEARKRLAKASSSVQNSIDALESVANIFAAQVPDIELFFDLAELSGYGYHTGIIFAAYAQGQGAAIAQGGRYDGIGQAFGKSRPATGFSADMRLLNKISESTAIKVDGILAPFAKDPDLQATIKKLRTRGERVVVELPGAEASASDLGCNRKLVKGKAGWEVSNV